MKIRKNFSFGYDLLISEAFSGRKGHRINQTDFHTKNKSIAVKSYSDKCEIWSAVTANPGQWQLVTIVTGD